jgi:DNA topoisomerase-2
MYLYDSDLKIKKYNSTIDIIKEWSSVRLTCYFERKNHQLKILDKLFIKLNAKAKFINDIINNNIIIMNVDDSIVIKKLEELNYPKLSDNDNDNDDDDNVDNDKKSYNYLLKLPVSSLTSNNFKKLEENALKIKNEIEILKNTPIYTIWLNELNELKNAYNIYKTDLEEIYNNDLKLIKSKKK